MKGLKKGRAKGKGGVGDNLAASSQSSEAAADWAGFRRRRMSCGCGGGERRGRRERCGTASAGATRAAGANRAEAAMTANTPARRAGPREAVGATIDGGGDIGGAVSAVNGGNQSHWTQVKGEESTEAALVDIDGAGGWAVRRLGSEASTCNGARGKQRVTISWTEKDEP